MDSHADLRGDGVAAGRRPGAAGGDTRVIIALASPRPAASINDGLARVERLIMSAAAQGGRIVCFPEAYLPGLRGQDFEVPAWDASVEASALSAVCDLARTHAMAVVMGLEHVTPGGRQIVAVVIDRDGRAQGQQTKNQLDPSMA
jgi:predicted amidohydrolase